MFSVYYVVSLVRSVTFVFSSLEYLDILYFILLRSKLEYASVVSNSVTSADANQLDLIQQKFVALCFNCSFHHICYSYAYALGQLKLHTLCKTWYHLFTLHYITWIRSLPK
jgi:hypothetical protein